VPALKDLPIIAMTAHILERDKEQAFAAGMNRVVAKPISYESIRAVLDEFALRVEKSVA
jgi:CheY-like chemotaxis protein